jgi:hypothetical protein
MSYIMDHVRLSPFTDSYTDLKQLPASETSQMSRKAQERYSRDGWLENQRHSSRSEGNKVPTERLA